MTGRQSLIVVIALAFILNAGCGRDNKTAAHQELTDKAVEAQVRIDIKGAESARIDQKARLHFVARKGKGSQMEASLVSVSLFEPAPVGDGRLLLTETAVVGTYTGQKEIVVPPAGPKGNADPNVTARGIANVTVINSAGDGSEKKYSLSSEPCSLVVEKQGGQGSAHCPLLVAATGEKVSLRMTWTS